MSTSDGNSTTRPLRQRKSKRFDRSGGSPQASSSTVLDDDLDVELPGELPEAAPVEEVAVTAEPEVERRQPIEPAAVEERTDPTGPDDAAEPVETIPVTASVDGTDSAVTDPNARSRTLDELGSCGHCGHEVSTVNIAVDGNVLMMESCDNCDTRRWHLAGEAIELQNALDHVGEHTGRRR